MIIYKLEAQPEFPEPNGHHSFVYYWVDIATGERHGPFSFRTGAVYDAVVVHGAVHFLNAEDK